MDNQKNYDCNQTDCYTYFSIRGNFDPDKITELLELKPDKYCKIGDKRKHGNSKYDVASWDFGTCKEYDVFVENQMLKTITPLLSKVDILKEIKRQYDVSFFLEVVPTVYLGESTPCLAPSIKVMQFCCDTGTEMDIDLYVDYLDDFDTKTDK